MPTIIRLAFAAALAVSVGFVWTVGQTGLQQTNRNLCELWASLPLPKYESCEFQNDLVYVWACAAVAAVVWLLLEFFRFGPVRRQVEPFFAIAKSWCLGRVRMIEPYHIIILGLIIVVGGLVWQLRRTPPEVISLRTEVANLQRGLADAVNKRTSTQTPDQGVGPTQQPTTDQPPVFTTEDIKKMLTALAQMQTIIGTQVREAYEATQFVSLGMLKTGGAAAVVGKLQPIRDAMRQANKDLSRLLFDYRYYDSELLPVIAGYDSVLGWMDGSLTPIIDDLNKYSSGSTDVLEALVRERFVQWANERASHFDKWYGGAEIRIRNETKRIREWPRVIETTTNATVGGKSQDGRPAIPRIAYTERDIREMLDALDEGQDLIEKRIMPLWEPIQNRVINGFYVLTSVGLKQTIASLNESKNSLQTKVWPPINDFVYKEHSGYQNEMRLALALDSEAARGELTRALQVLIDRLQLFPESPDKLEPKQFELVRADYERAEKLNNEFWQWLTTAQSRIKEMKNNLRQKGVTGYETP